MDVRIPSLAESVTEGEIGAWLKKDGEQVRKNDPILELQTDKASLEIAAEASGVLRTLKAVGDTVQVGEVVARIEEGQGALGAPSARAEKPASAPAPRLAAAPQPPTSQQQPRAAQPAPEAASSTRDRTESARRAASQNAGSAEQATPPPPREVAPTAVSRERYETTDPGHAIVHERVALAPAEHAPERPPEPTRAPASAAAEPRAPVEAEPGTRRERMSRLRRRIAERLVEAQHQAAILTTFNEIDMTAAMALRQQHQEWFTRRYGVKLGFMSLFGRACIKALEEVPDLNASIDGEDIVYHDHVHLGIAVQTEKGLVVPVVRNAESLGLGALEKEISRLAAVARSGRIALDDLQGGTFTISNGGVFGSLLSTPILNPPQTGILGMHTIKQRPICLPDGSIAGRPMMFVALSYDHRLIDGRQAVTFLVRVKERLEDADRMVLES